MTRTTPELVPPFQISSPHQREDFLPTAHYLECSIPTYTADLQWNRVSSLKPSGPKASLYHLDRLLIQTNGAVKTGFSLDYLDKYPGLVLHKPSYFEMVIVILRRGQTTIPFLETFTTHQWRTSCSPKGTSEQIKLNGMKK
ncbi:hypothetical protein AVEN_20834-1 [Araneus ventricosus]|uniref:Uncharacterized protein n=1 Tax=Araneus ventricosus TaxID=182803 RepID=A0A4Y2JFY0_ARAVE|nr:hypothetical protein AVEN_20834-1 [Araneus ventricosus]